MCRCVVNPKTINGEGRSFEVHAKGAVRDVLAERLGLAAVHAMTAQLHIGPMAGLEQRVLVITGSVQGRVVLKDSEEACTVDESFEVYLVLEESALDVLGWAGAVHEPDWELWDGKGYNVGELAVQYLALGIPLRGQEGSTVVHEDAPPASPFQALAALRDRQ